MSNMVTLRSYSCYLHFLHLIFGEKWFLQLCPTLPSFVQKPQGILGVNEHGTRLLIRTCYFVPSYKFFLWSDNLQ
jgi:hypothetical protein